MKYIEITEGKIPNYSLDAKYSEFNSKYFNNELPIIMLKWRVMKSVGGLAYTKISIDPYTKKQRPILDTMKITISNLTEHPEEEYDLILLHEMIHIWFFIKGNFKESHGLAFQQKAKEISLKYGAIVPLKDEFPKIYNFESGKPYMVVLNTKPDGSNTYGLYTPKLNPTETAVLKNSIEYLIERKRLIKVEIYIINSIIWTEYAAECPVKRKYTGGSYFFRNKEEQDKLINDLHQNGKIIQQYTENNIGSIE